MAPIEPSTDPRPDVVTLTDATGVAVTFAPVGTNALCALEDELHLTFGELMIALGIYGQARWSLKVTRTFLLACARQADPKTPLTEAAMGDLIDAAGFEALGAAVNQLIWPAHAKHGDGPQRGARG